jgi:hypothetical protein
MAAALQFAAGHCRVGPAVCFLTFFQRPHAGPGCLPQGDCHRAAASRRQRASSGQPEVRCAYMGFRAQLLFPSPAVASVAEHTLAGLAAGTM